MYKNQKGISMVSLVITIIVIIILAAVAFSGSEETISRSGFSGYVTDIDSVRTAFLTEGVTNLMGEQEAKNNSVTNAQAYNYLAKGATTSALPEDRKMGAWLSKAQANAIPCTYIEKDFAKEAIGIELPKRKVNTYEAVGIEISYFVTNKGDIFTWPPYYKSDDGLFYVNDTIPVAGSKVTSGDWLISGDDEKEMYKDGFAFMVNGVEIRILGTGEDVLEVTPDTPVEELRVMASVAYKDERNAESPKGVKLEGEFVAGGGNNNGGNIGENEDPDLSGFLTVEGSPLKFGKIYFNLDINMAMVPYADGRIEVYEGFEKIDEVPAGTVQYEGLNINMQGATVATCSEDGKEFHMDGVIYTLYEGTDICPHGDTYVKGKTEVYTGDKYCVYCGVFVETGSEILSGSLINLVQIGNYINYSSNGVTNWRVFDIQNGEILITPVEGVVGQVKLGGANGFVNAITEIENACSVYINNELGITADDVRSMTVEDINRVTGYISTASDEKYAYFLNNDSMFESTELIDSSYTKIKHTNVRNNAWEAPRFYKWDYAENFATDENGNKYAYPTEGSPVYVTNSYYCYDPSLYTHVKNDSVNVGSLLGDRVGWLASTSEQASAGSVNFAVRFAYGELVNTYGLIHSSNITDSFVIGVRPLVSLNPDFYVTGNGSQNLPWELSR